MIINLNDIESVNSAVKSITDSKGKKIIVSDNLLTISKINTVLKAEKTIGDFCSNDSIVFGLSYNDDVIKDMIEIHVNLNNVSCYEFLKTGEYVSDAQLETMSCKVHKAIGIIEFNESMKDKYNNLLFNEAICFLISNCPTEDIEKTKTEFIAKYENWKEKVNGANAVFEKAAINLFNMILSALTMTTESTQNII